MKDKLAIIVPYRNRQKHLNDFLSHIVGFLESKGPYRYEIIVVEQNDNDLFNRGVLLNAGAIVAKKRRCTELCFHDVDLLPEKVDYTLDSRKLGPIQLASNIITLDGRKEQVPFDYFGGVTKISVQDFEKVDGYSNLYEGWGFEDSDFLERCIRKKVIQKTEIPCPRTCGEAIRFSGKKGITDRQVDGPIRTAKEEGRQLVLYADFVPGYPTIAVGYEDMRLISICTKETDIGLSFDRYGCCRFTAWDTRYNQINLVSEKVPRVHQRIVGVLDFELNVFSLYRNGEHIESQTLRNTREIFYDPRSISIGISNNLTKGRRDYFTGDLLEAGIAITLRRDRDFFREFSAGEKTTADFGVKDFVKKYNSVILEGKGKITSIQNCEAAIGVPLLAPGVFRCLSHKDSKFDQPEVQRNQDRYFRVMRKEIRPKEGLSTVEDIYNIEYKNNMSESYPLTWVKVTKK